VRVHCDSKMFSAVQEIGAAAKLIINMEAEGRLHRSRNNLYDFGDNYLVNDLEYAWLVKINQNPNLLLQTTLELQAGMNNYDPCYIEPCEVLPRLGQQFADSITQLSAKRAARNLLTKNRFRNITDNTPLISHDYITAPTAAQRIRVENVAELQQGTEIYNEFRERMYTALGVPLERSTASIVEGTNITTAITPSTLPTSMPNVEQLKKLNKKDLIQLAHRFFPNQINCNQNKPIILQELITRSSSSHLPAITSVGVVPDVTVAADVPVANVDDDDDDDDGDSVVDAELNTENSITNGSEALAAALSKSSTQKPELDQLMDTLLFRLIRKYYDSTTNLYNYDRYDPEDLRHILDLQRKLPADLSFRFDPWINRLKDHSNTIAVANPRVALTTTPTTITAVVNPPVTVPSTTSTNTTSVANPPVTVPSTTSTNTTSVANPTVTAPSTTSTNTTSVANPSVTAPSTTSTNTTSVANPSVTAPSTTSSNITSSGSDIATVTTAHGVFGKYSTVTAKCFFVGCQNSDLAKDMELCEDCNKHCCKSCYKDGHKCPYGRVLCDSCAQNRDRKRQLKAIKVKEAKERKVKALLEAVNSATGGK
jgi:hypothetical protein